VPRDHAYFQHRENSFPWRLYCARLMKLVCAKSRGNKPIARDWWLKVSTAVWYSFVWASSTLVRSCRRETSQIRARERLCYLFYFFFVFLFGLLLFNRLIWFRASSGRAKQRVEPPSSSSLVVCCFVLEKRETQKEKDIYRRHLSIFLLVATRQATQPEKTSLRLLDAKLETGSSR
jgi:hypothetical protein